MKATWPERLDWRLERVRFEMCRAYWRVRYGRQRWQATEAGRLRVLSDDVRGYWLADGGGHHGALALWRSLLTSEPDLCVDIGANYGEFTAAADDAGVSVWAVEANPLLVGCLSDTFAGHPRVRVIHGAVSDRDGPVVLYSHPQCAGYGSVFARAVTRNRFLWRQSSTALTAFVPGHRLDSLIGASEQRPRSMLLKIDVEGAEPQVLRGASATFECCQWWRAVIEWSPFAIEAGDGSVDEAWEAYRSYPGVVLTSDVIPDGALAMLPALPGTPPAEKCDLLIGMGNR
jgi:FkbM family methyltransferase